jgi:hypothetical protein
MLTIVGATHARAEPSRSQAPVVEKETPCVEVSEGTIECELEAPPTEPEKEVTGKDGNGLGGATAVSGTEPKPEGPKEPEEGQGEEEEETSPSPEGEAPLKHAETLAAPETSSEAENGGTAAGSPRQLKELGPLPGSEATPGEPAAPPIADVPLVGGLAGASTLPLGQIELPPLLLPVYQACGTAYDVPWEVLAAINKIESGFGANMGPSSAGAIGPMQFMPATWAEDGLDADGDGVADALDPLDAICAAASYLHSTGAPGDLHAAVFAYNHADWYVEEVLREARNFEALPENMLASMTALAEGETMPAPRASGFSEVAGTASGSIPDWVSVPSSFTGAPRAEEGGEADATSGPAARVDAPAGSPVTAVAEGTVVARGHSTELGSYLILRDPYGARYTYSGLGPLRRQVKTATSSKGGKGDKKVVSAGSTGGRRRLYADPPGPRHRDQIALRKGTKVRAGQVLAEVGDEGHFDFTLQPDGSAPIAPTEFLHAWQRGGAGGIYLHPRGADRKGGATARAADAPHPATLLIAGEATVRHRALHDRLLKLPTCLRKRIAAGAIAPRALAGVEFLAAQRGERIGVSAAACAGEDRFRLRLTDLGGSAGAADLADAARRMQGALGPQRVHGPALATAELADSASPKASAAVARISSSSAEPAAPEDPGAGLELDFLPPRSAELRGADAISPIDAPAAVQAMIAAADQINETPYIWGGGHGSWVSAGYDCSGSVSYVLHAAGLLSTPETSGSLASFGAPGPGRWVTIYANATHVYAEIAGLRWDTVGDAQGSGPRWHLEPPYPEGFVVRHPIGL